MSVVSRVELGRRKSNTPREQTVPSALENFGVENPNLVGGAFLHQQIYYCLEYQALADRSHRENEASFCQLLTAVNFNANKFSVMVYII